MDTNSEPLMEPYTLNIRWKIFKIYGSVTYRYFTLPRNFLLSGVESYCIKFSLTNWSIFILNSSMGYFFRDDIQWKSFVLRERICALFTSSRSQMFLKKGVLKNFAIFTGNHLCWSLCWSLSVGLKDCNFIKK